MQILDVVAGSTDWHRERAPRLTASEAPSMLGLPDAPCTRNELLRMKSTGLQNDVGEWVQKFLFDKGHEVEVAVLPIVEARLGTELFQATGATEIDGLPLLASFDGVSMDETLVWENKLLNKINTDLEFAINTKHWPQLEHQMLVAGIERIYFTVSDGTEPNTLGTWYWSKPERRKALIAGWKQFAVDLAEYQHVEDPVKLEAAPIETLPALIAQVEGRVISTNLQVFKTTTLEFIGKIKTDLQTDQDFADAKQMVKFCKDAEDRVEVVKAQTLSQMASVDELVRTLDHLKGEFRAKRLTLDNTVKTREASIKGEIVTAGMNALQKHVMALNARLGSPWMPRIAADFAGVISGKKTILSIRNAVDTELARAKIESNEIADRIHGNREMLRPQDGVSGEDWMGLFPDFAQVCTKPADDFHNLVKARVAARKAAEDKRVADEIARRDAEAKRQAEEKARADAAAAQQVQAPAAVHAPTMAPGIAPSAAPMLTASPGIVPAGFPVTTHIGVDMGGQDRTAHVTVASRVEAYMQEKVTEKKGAKRDLIYYHLMNFEKFVAARP